MFEQYSLGQELENILMRDRLEVFHFNSSTDQSTSIANSILRDKGCMEGNYTEDFGLKWTSLVPSDKRLARLQLHNWFQRLNLRPDDFRNKYVLDAGCGIGSVSEFFLQYATFVLGVDFSNSISVAANNLSHNPKFLPLQASIESLPIKDSTFDIVCSHGVVHHTSDPDKSIFELWRLIKPGGRLVIWVYPDIPFMHRRSLLVYFMSDHTVQEKLEFSDLLSRWGHLAVQNWIKGKEVLEHNLCFSVKNDLLDTVEHLFDGVCPTYHHILNEEYFSSLASKLPFAKRIIFGADIEEFQHPLTVTITKRLK